MFNVAITGVGGGVGQSILKSLAKTEYNLIALDGELLATDENYIDRLLDICQKEKIALLFPGLDAELMILSINREAFKAIGTVVVVSRPEVITISNDKQETYNYLTKAGINVPFTCSAENFIPKAENFPLILKQKVGGARSKNVFMIDNYIDWEATIEKIRNRLSDFIVMDYIEGDEYTCGTINLDNSCKGVIVMRRILRDGDTYKCFTEKNETIENQVRLVVETVKPFGACNVQIRVRDGKPYVFEINARCSGTTAARTLSGFNEPKIIADYLLMGLEPNYTIKEQTILRYWNELIVDNKTVNELSRNRRLNKNEFDNL